VRPRITLKSVVVTTVLLLLITLGASSGCGTAAANSGAVSGIAALQPVVASSAVSSTSTTKATSKKSTATSKTTTTAKKTTTTIKKTTTTVKKSDPTQPQVVQAGTPHAWGLAASALLTTFNGGQNDLLGTLPPTAQNVRDEKNALADWWGVENRKDLLDMLVWIDQGGQRKNWEEMAAYIAGLSSGELSDFVAKASANAELKHQVEMVQHYAPEFGKKSLLGWDYARYISLCRWGYLCGYITEKEAWDHIMPVAAMLQKTFTSWADLGQNYLIGREFWSYQQTLSEGGIMREAYQWLTTSSSSPWMTNSWNLNLGVSNPKSVS
jgi:hypothetical protein